MRIREMLAVVGLLTTVSGAAWGDCTSLYRTGAGSWSCGTGGADLEPFSLKTEDFGGVTGLTVWSLPSGDVFPPFVAKYVGTPLANGFGPGTLIVPGVFLMQAGQRFNCSCVQWTARIAGTVSFSGYFEELEQTPFGSQQNIYYDQTDITASAFSNGTGYFAGPGADLTKLKPGGQLPFDFQQAVVPGDTITFIVNTNGFHQYPDDLLGFKVHVTPIQ